MLRKMRKTNMPLVLVDGNWQVDCIVVIYPERLQKAPCPQMS